MITREDMKPMKMKHKMTTPDGMMKTSKTQKKTKKTTKRTKRGTK